MGRKDWVQLILHQISKTFWHGSCGYPTGMRIAQAIGSVLFLSASRTRFRSKCHNDVSSCGGFSHSDFTQRCSWDRSSRINRRVLLVSQALTPRHQASRTKLPIQSQEFSERLSFGPPQQFWIMLWKRKNWALLPCFYSFHSIRWGVLEMLQWQPMTRAYFQIYIATISALWRSRRIFSKCQIHYRIWVFWKCLAVSQLNLWFKFIPASIHSTVNSRECLQIWYQNHWAKPSYHPNSRALLPTRGNTAGTGLSPPARIQNHLELFLNHWTIVPMGPTNLVTGRWTLYS